MMITSSSSNSPSMSGSTFERGSTSYRPIASVARHSSNRSSLGISWGHTCALETSRTPRAANRSRASPYVTTFADSPSNAILSLMLLRQTSSVCSSLDHLQDPRSQARLSEAVHHSRAPGHHYKPRLRRGGGRGTLHHRSGQTQGQAGGPR
jgi:hypothetical protein